MTGRDLGVTGREMGVTGLFGILDDIIAWLLGHLHVVGGLTRGQTLLPLPTLPPSKRLDQKDVVHALETAVAGVSPSHPGVAVAVT